MTYQPPSIPSSSSSQRFSYQPYFYEASSNRQPAPPSQLCRFPFLNQTSFSPDLVPESAPRRIMSSLVPTEEAGRTRLVASQRFPQVDVCQRAVTAAQASNWEGLEKILSDVQSGDLHIPPDVAYEIIRACDRQRQFPLVEKTYALAPIDNKPCAAFLLAAGNAGKFDIAQQTFDQACDRQPPDPELYIRYARVLQQKQTEFPNEVCLRDFQRIFEMAKSTQSIRSTFLEAYLYALIPFNSTEEGKQEIERTFHSACHQDQKKNRGLRQAYFRAARATEWEDRCYKARRQSSLPFS